MLRAKSTIKKANLIVIEPEDILAFFNNNSKEKNDATNKVRETVISSIFDIGEDYFQDTSPHSEKWRDVRYKLDTILRTICSFPFTKVSIDQKGGRGYNHDFVVSFHGNNNKKETHKLEFKHNNTDVCGLVQFLELSDESCKVTHNMFDYSYSEYYYDKFIDDYMKLVTGTIEKPTKQVYVKQIKNTKYVHPFFSFIYDDRYNNETEKRALVQQSCEQYLQLYAPSFSFDKLTEKIKTSQQNKIFLFWDKNEFHIQELNVDHMAISGIVDGSLKPLCFDVNVNNFEYNIRVRLNWGNNNGIANPRWKFTFISKDK